MAIDRVTKNVKEDTIEKYDFNSLEKEQIPYTILPNNVIQHIKNPLAFLLWSFLQSLPKDWNINKHHLIKHFDISDSTYKRAMKCLNDLNLIEYRQERDSEGRFSNSRLIVLNGSKFNKDGHFDRSVKFEPAVNQSSVENPLCGEIAIAVNDPHTNTTHLQTQKEEIKENISKTLVRNDKNPVIRTNEREESSFNLFYENYPRKEQRKTALQKFKKLKVTEELLQIILSDIKIRYKGTEKQFIPLPANYLCKGIWEDEIVKKTPVYRGKGVHDNNTFDW